MAMIDECLWNNRPLPPATLTSHICVTDRGGAIYVSNSTRTDWTLESAYIQANTVAAGIVSTTAYGLLTDTGDTGIKSGSNILSGPYVIPFTVCTGLTSSGWAAGANALWMPIRSDRNIVFNKAVFLAQVAATSDGSHYWTIQLNSLATDGTTLTSMATAVDTSALTAATAARLQITTFSPASPVSTDLGLVVTIAKVSTPGNLLLSGYLVCQDILA